MQEVLEKLEARKGEVARHPLYTWMESDCVSLEDRFIFAPVFVNFIMMFSDLNKWFLRYPSPQSELQKAINQHTVEDEAHSRLFLEDWKKLGFDERLGWTSGDMIEWYYAAGETEIFRQFGMEIMQMCVLHEDPLVRFALMSAIEACGHVFFTVTSRVATRLAEETGKDYRYFGPYHLKRETGHVLTGGHPPPAIVVLDGWQRERSLALVDRIFDMFVVENDRLLAYAGSMLRNGHAPRAADRQAALDPAKRCAQEPNALRAAGARAMTPVQAEVERVLDERKRQAAGHDFFRWMQQKDDLAADNKLKRFLALWTPDTMGYRDLARYALAYPNPANARERAIHRWAAELQSHHRLFLRDWAELGMDAVLGWTACDTLRFYCLSEHTEMQRRNMASFVKLAYVHPDPVLRFWLIAALEASGEAFFDNTCVLAEKVEEQTHKRLDYLAGRHAVSHPVLARDDEADAVDFRSEPLSPAGRDTAIGMIHTVFDAISAQYSLSLDLAERNVFMIA